MALDKIHLRKLLKLMLMTERARATAVRADAREVMKKQDEGPSAGGDFHVPFWNAAKSHAAGRSNLHDDTADHISKNARRKRLYPQLRDGFLLWWNEKRRWINEPIQELPNAINSSYGFADIEGVVKVENLLSLQLGEGRYRYIYPYFADKPLLDAEHARLGLWLMSRALPQHSVEDMRILDVLRGQAFSIDRYPLYGSEEEEFTLKYRRILRDWRTCFR